MISNDLDDKYYELEEAISILEMQIKESKDKEVISILEDCKNRTRNRKLTKNVALICDENKGEKHSFS